MLYKVAWVTVDADEDLEEASSSPGKISGDTATTIPYQYNANFGEKLGIIHAFYDLQYGKLQCQG